MSMTSFRDLSLDHDHNVVFADLINKVTRSSGKVSSDYQLLC
jgi:hypothetical protein